MVVVITRMDIVCRAYYALRTHWPAERLRANVLLSNKRLEKRAARVPLAVMSEDQSYMLAVLECRNSPSRYQTQRVRRMGRLARAPVVEIAGVDAAMRAVERVQEALGRAHA